MPPDILGAAFLGAQILAPRSIPLPEGTLVKPHLIIISGPPAAGKSTCARPIASALGYPLLCMDSIKERLADAIGPASAQFADTLGKAAVYELIADASELLHQGIPVIVEGFFLSEKYSENFARLASLADSVLVHLLADDAVLKDRYEQRALRDTRHWIHRDRENLPHLQTALPPHMAERLHLDVPNLIINTTHRSVDIPATASLILRELQPVRAEQLV